MDIKELRDKKMLLLDCISGSRAYGLHTPQSDTDLKGVFLLPKRMYYGLEYTEQVNNETNDEVYYELKRYIELLALNNPNILELLNTPDDCVKFKHPIIDLLKPELFLSKLCFQTFAGYAMSQIKKARGLNKKILNPIDLERKSVLHFCYISHLQGSIPLLKWLEDNKLKQEDCGLISVSNMREIYALFHNRQLSEGYLKGICSSEDSNEVSLSSIEKGIVPIAIMSFNKDGYSKYCKDYNDYWTWVDKRNDVRYENTIEHGKNYDAKNIMHTFRLLNMAEEIAKYGVVNVRRHDREELLKIKSGAFEYEDLLNKANDKLILIEELFKQSQLQDKPDSNQIEEILFEIRENIYSKK
jgi:uncharacterized protein